MKIAKLSNVINKGVKIICKVVTDKFYTVVVILIELITATEKSKGYNEQYHLIS